MSSFEDRYDRRVCMDSGILLDNVSWVVGLDMDVIDFIVRLSVRFEGSGFEVKIDMEVADDGKVTLCDDFKFVFFKYLVKVSSNVVVLLLVCVFENGKTVIAVHSDVSFVVLLCDLVQQLTSSHTSAPS